MIELPLSVSVIMAGIRNALVVAIGITAIGVFVGAGGVGDIIIRGNKRYRWNGNHFSWRITYRFNGYHD